MNVFVAVHHYPPRFTGGADCVLTGLDMHCKNVVTRCRL